MQHIGHGQLRRCFPDSISDYKFAEKARRHPTFGVDLLEQARETLGTLENDKNGFPRVQDRITGKVIYVNSLSALLNVLPGHEHPGYNTHFLTREQLYAAGHLPHGHALRRFIAAASVEGYLQNTDHNFAREASKHLTLGMDLLREAEHALETVFYTPDRAFCEDPIYLAVEEGGTRTLTRRTPNTKT
jgi:hypothetical protein